MAKQNKILNSEYREWIEELISAGTPVREIEKICKEKGFSVSYSTINNYKVQYMEGAPSPDEIEQQDTFGESISTNIDRDGDQILLDTFYQALERFVEVQEKYMEGTAVFPSTALKSLKALHNVLRIKKISISNRMDLLKLAYERQLNILSHAQELGKDIWRESKALKDIHEMIDL